jgi:hypothetical protein
MTDTPKGWTWTAEDVLLLVLVPASSVGAWFLPEPYLRYLFAILILGLLFDVLSLTCHLATLATGRFSSGLPLVGLFLYGWFVLAYRRSLVAPQENELTSLMLYKLVDLLLLGGLHLFFQLPMFFQGPRER